MRVINGDDGRGVPAGDLSSSSTYSEVVAKLFDLAESLGEEYPDVDPGELFTDLAASVLIDVPRPVAMEVCRCQLGFVPAGLLAAWQLQDGAR